MDPKEELTLMTEIVNCSGIFTVFQTSRFRGFWQARVVSVVDELGKVAILGMGIGKTEQAACVDCLSYWARVHKNPEVPNAGSVDELRLKMLIGGLT